MANVGKQLFRRVVFGPHAVAYLVAAEEAAARFAAHGLAGDGTIGPDDVESAMATGA